MKNLFKECDVVYLSYDEPEKEKRYHALKKLLPHAQWVDGIKGLDSAHRACAEVGSKSRVVVIDGDNHLFLKKVLVKEELLKSPYVLSFVSQNSINDLVYGNGGIKCWPRELLKNCSSHELAGENKGVDFVFDTPYFQMPQLLSVTEIHQSAKLAFRAGFREAIKLVHVNGVIVPRELALKDGLEFHLPKTSLYRLRTWLQIGRDITHGSFAMLGARVGLGVVLIEGTSEELVSDYDWLETQIKKYTLLSDAERETELLANGERLKDLFKSPLNEYDSLASELYKSAMVATLEKGPIQKAAQRF